MTPISEAVETYLYTVASLSKNTLYTYTRKLGVFQRFCEAHNLSLEEITPKVFRAYAEHIAARTTQGAGEPVSTSIPCEMDKAA